jgi:hypothetical protein
MSFLIVGSFSHVSKMTKMHQKGHIFIGEDDKLVENLEVSISHFWTKTLYLVFFVSTFG